MASTEKPVFRRDRDAEYLSDGGARRIIFRSLVAYDVVRFQTVWVWVREQFPHSLSQPNQTIFYNEAHELYIFTDESEATIFQMRWC